MKKLILGASFILAAVLLQASRAPAQFLPASTASPGSVPSGFNYQGRLEESGFPVTGTKTMTFRVYDAPTGGNLLWSSSAQSMSVQQGLFNTVIDVSTTALAGGGTRFVEVQVESTILSPREQLYSVPYALMAKTIEGTLDISHGGLSVSSSPTAGTALYVSSYTGNIGIGTMNPGTPLEVNGIAQFGSGAAKSTFTAAGALIMAAGSPIALSGGGGYVLSLSSVNASGFFGVSATLTGDAGIAGTATMGAASVTGLAQMGSAAVTGAAQMGSASVTGAASIGGAASIAGGATVSGSSLTIVDANAAHPYVVLVTTSGNRSSGNLVLENSGELGVGTLSPAARVHISSPNATASDVLLGVSSGSALSQTLLMVAGDAKVGVGTGSPATRLHVQSDAQTVATFERAMAMDGQLRVTDASGSSTFLRHSNGTGYVDATNILQLQRGGAERLSLMSAGTRIVNGGLNIGGTNPPASGLVVETGSVGVGAPAPGTLVHVSSGSLRVDGTNAADQLQVIGPDAGNNASVLVDATAGGQAALKLRAGLAGTNRAARIDLLNTNASAATPRWTLINDYSQNGTNDFNITNAAATRVMTILQGGYVGINQTNPGTNHLQVGGTVSVNNGTNTVYRCATAGALPIGALTINAASCGTTADTGLRVN